jgi:hypothetical protein
MITFNLWSTFQVPTAHLVRKPQDGTKVRAEQAAGRSRLALRRLRCWVLVVCHAH